MKGGLMALILLLTVSLSTVGGLAEADAKDKDKDRSLEAFGRREELPPGSLLLHTWWAGGEVPYTFEILLQSFFVTQPLQGPGHEPLTLVVWGDHEWSVSHHAYHRHLVHAYASHPYVVFRRFVPLVQAAGTCMATYAPLTGTKDLMQNSDLVRLILLHNYGGMWVDSDSFFLLPVAPFFRAHPNGYPLVGTNSNNNVLTLSDPAVASRLLQLACSADPFLIPAVPSFGPWNDLLMQACAEHACGMQPFPGALVDPLWAASVRGVYSLGFYCDWVFGASLDWSRLDGSDPDHNKAFISHARALKKCHRHGNYPHGAHRAFADRMRRLFALVDVKSPVHRPYYDLSLSPPPWMRQHTPLLLLVHTRPEHLSRRTLVRRWASEHCGWTSNPLERLNLRWEFRFALDGEPPAAHHPFWLEYEAFGDLLVAPSGSLSGLYAEALQQWHFEQLLHCSDQLQPLMQMVSSYLFFLSMAPLEPLSRIGTLPSFPSSFAHASSTHFAFLFSRDAAIQLSSQPHLTIASLPAALSAAVASPLLPLALTSVGNLSCAPLISLVSSPPTTRIVTTCALPSSCSRTASPIHLLLPPQAPEDLSELLGGKVRFVDSPSERTCVLACRFHPQCHAIITREQHNGSWRCIFLAATLAKLPPRLSSPPENRFHHAQYYPIS